MPESNNKGSMKKHLRIKTEDETSTHFGGVFDDHTLCGLTLGGDEYLKISVEKSVKTKVTCDDCISIVKFCKSIESNEF